MGATQSWLQVFVLVSLVNLVAAASTFDEQFDVVWAAPGNVLNFDSTNAIELSLTENGGANFHTNKYYLHGSFSVKLKLIPGESAGTVTAFYLTSFGDNHDEIDFEFLGNETGQPYTCHTNLFVNGTGGREQRIKLWFDPSADYHTYTIIWNHYQVVWLVDGITVRFYRNLEHLNPGTYPLTRPMVASSCIFDASAWATQDGRKPALWQYSPFIVSFKDYVLDACDVHADGSIPCNLRYRANWWEGVRYQSLDQQMRDQLLWVTRQWKVYDYCYDVKRYPRAPKYPLECQYNVPWVRP